MGIRRVTWESALPAPSEAAESAAAQHLDAACEQLDAYFAGERKDFEVALDLEGTAFQQLVWQALVEIPFGETQTYGALADRIARPTAVRAVGAANGRNPVAIIVPCHRVVGADGALTGFAGGLARKRFLLDHEAAVAGLVRPGRLQGF